jgi:tRNA 2-thiocytidine biosynthesis protein TtcA
MPRAMDSERRLFRELGRAIANHDLIRDGDRILVAMSGGKDSYGMLVLLRDLQRRAPVRFDLLAVHLDQGHPGYDGAPLRAWLEDEGVPYSILREDTYSIVTDKIPEGKTYCSLCSRLRRGVLYKAADDLGCNKIALGHHREDAIETLLLNLFFAGKLSSMPPRLLSDDGRHVVIRPLILCAEADLAELAARRKFPILPCNLCGSQSEAQRRQMKNLIAELEAKHPTVRASMAAALGNVVPSHLMDARLTSQRRETTPASPTEPVSGEGALRAPAGDRLVPVSALRRGTLASPAHTDDQHHNEM